MNPVFYGKVDSISGLPDIAHDASGNTFLGDFDAYGLGFSGVSSGSEIGVSNPVREQFKG
jgi:hypothetical protein